MEHLGHKTLDDIRIAFLQKIFLDGAYKSECCLKTVDNKLIRGDVALTDYTEESFTKYMTSVSTNSSVYNNGKMKSMNGNGISRSVTGGPQTSSSENLPTR